MFYIKYVTNTYQIVFRVDTRRDKFTGPCHGDLTTLLHYPQLLETFSFLQWRLR